MSKVEELEREIEKLEPEDAARLRDWILDRDWAAWDRQIERDAAAGKLEKLFDKGLGDHDSGKSCFGDSREPSMRRLR